MNHSADLRPALRNDRPTSSVPPACIPKRQRCGTHRSLAPEETIERARRAMHAMGITRVAQVTHLDILGIPVVSVCRPNARSVSVCYGKGLTLSLAKASGLMESIEAYHAEHITLPLRLGSFHELSLTHRVAGVDSPSCLAQCALHRAARMLWIEGVDILQGLPVWLPFDMVHTDDTLPRPPGSGAFSINSGGLASGNHRLEAISHGICELVEHDSTALWQLRTEETEQRARIDLDTVDDPVCHEVIRRYERAGMDVAVWETTTDIGVASFLCTVTERSGDPGQPELAAHGTACHPAREIALLSALTEAAESRLRLLTGARELRGLGDISPPCRGHDHPPASRTQRSRPPRSFRDVPSHDGDSVNDDVQWLLDRLRAAGLVEVVVVDLTKREFNIPVVRVIISGLEALRDESGYDPGARASRILLEGES